jgi:integrase
MRAKQRRPGGPTYYYYDDGGKPRKDIPLGSDYVLAVQKWAELNMSPNPVLPTVGYAIAQYLASPAYNERGTDTQKDYKFAIDKLVVAFGDAPLDQITPAHLNKYLMKRGVESKHRAQREVAILGMIFRFARGLGLTKNDPKEAVTLKKLPGRKAIYISDDMLDAVYSKAAIDLKDAMDLAYYIGQRPADVITMRKVNAKDGYLEYRQGKTGTPQRIALIGPLAELLERIERRKAEHAVTSIYLLVDEAGGRMTKHKLRARFEKARTDAGIAGKDFQFRDLRRKSGTDLRDQAGLDAAQDLLGHASQAMTEHYTAARGKKIHRIPLRKQP